MIYSLFAIGLKRCGCIGELKEAINDVGIQMKWRLNYSEDVRKRGTGKQ